MGEAVWIAGVGEEGMMEVELGTEQEEQKKKDCSKEVKDDHDDCSTKEVIRWEKFLPRMVLRVLLVEADDSTRQIIAALLRKCGYRVAAVADGLKAWETVKGKSDDIDLILTEVELPSISGFALLTLVMEHDSCKNIPVIMMSSHDSISMALKCMLKGAADFLIKPIRKNELRNLWQHVWRRHAQKVEATSENNAASSHLGDCVANTQNEKCNYKESDSQISSISCTTHFMEAENACMENMQGLYQLKSKSISNLSNGDRQRNEVSTKLDKEMETQDSKVGEEASICNEALNLKSMEVEEDHRLVKTVIQDKIVRPECSRGNASVSALHHGCNNEVVVTSRKPADLIGTIDQVLRTTDGNSGFNDQRNKFNQQLLELTLRNGPTELNQQRTDERQTLKHSNASAFSWYSTKPVHCISSLYPEGSAKGNSSYQHGFMSHEPRNSTSTFFAQSGQAESKLPGHDQGLIPVSGVSLDKSSGQGQVIPSMFCQDSGARWSINQVCHPEKSTSSANTSFQLNDPQKHGSEHGFYRSADIANNPIMLETVRDVKNLVPKEELRHGSLADQSASTDPVSHINGSSYGSMGSGSNENENYSVVASSARETFDDDTCSMHDGVRTHYLHSNQREAALTKFRLKRKDRCFEKKVRYQSRKRLAEQRPRVKGQFVRQAHTDPSLADTG